MAINLVVYFNGFPIKLPAFNAPPHRRSSGGRSSLTSISRWQRQADQHRGIAPGHPSANHRQHGPDHLQCSGARRHRAITAVRVLGADPDVRRQAANCRPAAGQSAGDRRQRLGRRLGSRDWHRGAPPERGPARRACSPVFVPKTGDRTTRRRVSLRQPVAGVEAGFSRRAPGFSDGGRAWRAPTPATLARGRGKRPWRAAFSSVSAPRCSMSLRVRQEFS